MTEQEPSKEQLILQAAAHEFALKGFDGARTTTIAAMAGVNHAMLHYYFRTKEQLFEQVFMGMFSQLIEMMTTIITQPGRSLKERIAAGVGAHFDFMRSHSDLPPFVINAINREPARMEELRQRMISRIGTFLKPMQDELNHAADCGMANRIDIISLIINMVSLNVGPFIIRPVIESALSIKDYEAILDAKREENINIILKICFD